MKWYFWVLIAIVVLAIIGYFVWKNQMKKNGLVEGSDCTIVNSTPEARTVGEAVVLPVKYAPIAGIVVNGICVKK